jgi:transposase-like protein
VGVNTEEQREVLGVKVGASEAEPFWTEFLRSLNRRGVKLDLSPYPGDQHQFARSLREGISVRGDSMGVVTPDGE